MEVFNELVYEGINVDVLHADRTQAQRDRIVDQFRIGKIWVLIATDIVVRSTRQSLVCVNCILMFNCDVLDRREGWTFKESIQ